MRRAWLGALVALLFAAAPAWAQTIYFDYDKEYDFKKVKTWAWGKAQPSNLELNHPLIHNHVIGRIESYLTQAGLQKVEENPDVYVIYHTNSEQEVSVDSTSMGYGYPPGWTWSPYYAGYWGPTTVSTTVRSYTRGTLLIDMWDGKTKQLAWRGSATDIVPENPEKAKKKIDKCLDKMVKKWKKTYRPAEKEK